MTSKILIVGAGIAGLGVARALVQRGFAVEIVERARAPRISGAGIYIPANGFRALEGLGLSGAVAERAVTIPSQRFLDRRGRLLSEVNLTEVWGAVGPCLSVTRAELHEILLDGLPDGALRFGASVNALRQRVDSVSVEFSDGSAADYALVVGADGVHSSIRSLVFESEATRPLGQASWRFLAPSRTDVSTWTVMLGHDSAFLMIPVSPSQVYCYADVAMTRNDQVAGDDFERLRALFLDFAEPVPSLLAHLEYLDATHFTPIEEVPEGVWVRGRVVLIGDAAHAMSPNMAEGAALALEDGLVLARMLAEKTSLVDALATFCAVRHGRVRWVRRQTHQRDAIRTLPLALRNSMLRLAGGRIHRSSYAPMIEERWLAADG